MMGIYRWQFFETLSLQIISIILCGLFFGGCNENPKQVTAQDTQRLWQNDTVIGSKVITNELAGSMYRKRAKGYFVIHQGDTSAFTCTFSQAKSNGKISIDMRFRNDMSYRQQWAEVNKVIPLAMKDFGVNMDSLSTVFISRLITTGDLAIQVSRQYYQRFGDDRTLSHHKVSSFLMQTALVSEWNAMLQPYGVIVDTVSTEKNFFASKQDVFDASRIETDSLQVPGKILDCMIWIKLKRRRITQT